MANISCSWFMLCAGQLEPICDQGPFAHREGHCTREVDGKNKVSYDQFISLAGKEKQTIHLKTYWSNYNAVFTNK